MVTLENIPTPALVLERGRLQANCDRMKERCRALGVRLRPHMKTLKSIDALYCATDASDRRIAVATLNEAEYFAERGVEDIQYAVCMSPDRLPRAASILRKAPGFSFFVDSVDVVEQVIEFARRNDAPLRVWLEIDSGEHRTGFHPEDPALLESAQRLSESVARFQGVATHAGQSYGMRGKDELSACAEQERAIVCEVAARLSAVGILVPGVSAGSTPTVMNLRSAQGLTELRAGVYMAGDLFQVSVGSLSLSDVAVTVLTSVISQNRRLNQIVVDAGGLALSKDRSTVKSSEAEQGYGLVLDVLGRPIVDGLTIAAVHQEHGEIRSSTALPFDQLPIGTRLRIVPNHICMTAAMYGEYVVVEGSNRVIGHWKRTNGWS